MINNIKRKVTKKIREFCDPTKQESKKAKEVKIPNKIKKLWKAK